MSAPADQRAIVEAAMQLAYFTGTSPAAIAGIGTFASAIAPVAMSPSVIACLALRGLHAELMLFPKPGLVSMVDSGSHDDMDAHLFMRSLFSLRGYFKAAAAAGAQQADFATLNALGRRAEIRMLDATGGINTHRGAIFCLGLLSAACGRATATAGAQRLTPARLRSTLMRQWGKQLALHCNDRSPDAHGTRVALSYGQGGARSQAAQGMPAVFDLALPVLRAALHAGRGWECARIDAFFHLMARLDDSNVLHRGGVAGARLVRECGERFIVAGGTASRHWRTQALAAHRLLVAHRLSPGGAADMLAAACFVHMATQRGGHRGVAQSADSGAGQSAYRGADWRADQCASEGTDQHADGRTVAAAGVQTAVAG